MAGACGDELLEQFRAWLEENGAALDKLEFRRSAHGNGVFARAPIGEGEEYARIPKRLIITESVCREELREVELAGRALLCTFLVHQRFVSQDSFWKPYMDILPSDIPTPLCFTDAELGLLKGTPMEHAVADRRKSLQSEHQEAQRAATAAIPEDEFGFDRYVWAANVVSSRGFGQAMGGDNVLLPLLDMMNHRPLTRVTWAVGDDSVAFAAGATMREGAEVMNNYGAKSNEELLLGYGFCAPSNPLNYYHIRLNYSQDPLAVAKQEILELTGAADLDHYIRISGLPRNLMPMLRVMVMTEVDVYYTQNQLAGKAPGDGWAQQLGLRIELRAHFLLTHLLRNKLQALGPVAAVDTPCGRQAMQYRDETRAILQSTLANLDRAAHRLLGAGRAAFDEGRHLLPSYMSSDGLPAVGDSGDNDQSSDDAGTDGDGGGAPKRARTSPPFADVLLSRHSFASDDEFADAVEQVDIDEDVLLALFVLRCQMRPESPWHGAVVRLVDFVHPMMESGTDEHAETMMEMGEIHDALFPLLSDHFPDVFPPERFTPELFLWAAGIVEACRLRIPADLVDGCGSGAASVNGDDDSSDGGIEGLCLV
ncbi:hypothetical protein LPJ61_002106 [Coemansia biformis]|uniref:SET domain-containing protein n=1 Tax=Coemansia biformis TaxID=1286918 RepID=A0A9W7Y8X3_9FUNG|nr:hypothetical protein LPJ61_002106 [Coemansia biformis]